MSAKRLLYVLLIAALPAVPGCRSKTSKNRDIWRAPDQTPIRYATAAKEILEALSADEGQWLTLGTVLEALGPPSAMRVKKYPFEDCETVEDDPLLLTTYEDKGVAVYYSVAGIVNYVLYRQGGTMPGWSSWPVGRQLRESSEGVTITGCFTRMDNLVPLQTEAIKFALAKRTEADWYEVLTGVKPKKSPAVPPTCTPSVYLIDGIKPDLARVGLMIKGKRTLMYHTWWQKRADAWVHISSADAVGLIVGKASKSNPSSRRRTSSRDG
jgi:hypothetical protein